MKNASAHSQVEWTLRTLKTTCIPMAKYGAAAKLAGRSLNWICPHVSGGSRQPAVRWCKVQRCIRGYVLMLQKHSKSCTRNWSFSAGVHVHTARTLVNVISV